MSNKKTPIDASRRKVLKGAGASIALPMLDAMIPAATAQPAAKLRLGFVYIPHGAVYQNWTPAATGSDFEMSQILASLADYKSHL